MPVQKPAKPVKPALPVKPKPAATPPAPSRPPLSKPAAPATRPAMNPVLAAQREMRRQAQRQTAQQLSQNRPRPAVRPAAPPQKIMPKVPQPSTVARGKVESKPVVVDRRPKRFTAAAAPALTAFGLIALNSSGAHADIVTEASSLENSLSSLQQRSAFSDIISDITSLDNQLNKVLELLESAREKGYRYQGDIEKEAYDAMGRWETVRPQVVSTVQLQAQTLQSQLGLLNPQIQRLNNTLSRPTVAAPLLRTTQSQVNNVMDQIERIERDLHGRYSQIEECLNKLNTRLNQIHWAMDQLQEAKFTLARDEDLVMAVPARWDKEGKEDPEGVLYLTNRRLVFERKEKVATKKILFITTASELVHEVAIDQSLANIRSAKGENKGLFGHQDFLLVEFSGGNLGSVAFHINGQLAKDWETWVNRARGGQLEAERVNVSGGLSVSDFTGPLTAAHILDVQNEVNNLQDEMMLPEARQELVSLENEVRSLERRLSKVRAKGYEVERDLEAEITVLATQWDRIKANTEATLEYQTRMLGEQMAAIKKQAAELAGLSANLEAARPVYMQVKSAIASAEAQAEAAEATVLAQYDEYADEVEALAAHLDWVDWMLQALATASFSLMAEECGIAATEAVFKFGNLEPENGILFLTDRRLLWEDRVGDYELKVDVPLNSIVDVDREADEQSGKESLIIKFQPPAALDSGRFELSLPVAEDWITMIGRAKTGGYSRDRVAGLSQEELDRIRNAPQQCPTCGAVFTAPLLRGQSELRCEYCGLVTKI